MFALARVGQGRRASCFSFIHPAATCLISQNNPAAAAAASPGPRPRLPPPAAASTRILSGPSTILLSTPHKYNQRSSFLQNPLQFIYRLLHQTLLVLHILIHCNLACFDMDTVEIPLKATQFMQTDPTKCRDAVLPICHCSHPQLISSLNSCS